jgi:hypothetical protein
MPRRPCFATGWPRLTTRLAGDHVAITFASFSISAAPFVSSALAGSGRPVTTVTSQPYSGSILAN